MESVYYIVRSRRDDFICIVTIGSIVLSDLVLSGDNALIIGVAASGLPKKQRLWAIVCGGGGARVLRILFTILASVALQIPFIGACGSIILLGIAVKILLSRSKDANISLRINS